MVIYLAVNQKNKIKIKKGFWKNCLSSSWFHLISFYNNKTKSERNCGEAHSFSSYQNKSPSKFCVCPASGCWLAHTASKTTMNTCQICLPVLNQSAKDKVVQFFISSSEKHTQRHTLKLVHFSYIKFQLEIFANSMQISHNEFNCKQVLHSLIICHCILHNKYFSYACNQIYSLSLFYRLEIESLQAILVQSPI